MTAENGNEEKYPFTVSPAVQEMLDQVRQDNPDLNIQQADNAPDMNPIHQQQSPNTFDTETRHTKRRSMHRG